MVSISSKLAGIRYFRLWVRESLRHDPGIMADARKLEEVRQKDLVQLSACYRS
jgi:hypothetical protein